MVLLQNKVRNYAYLDLMRILQIERPLTKKLVFAWFYRATEEILQSILKEKQTND